MEKTELNKVRKELIDFIVWERSNYDSIKNDSPQEIAELYLGKSINYAQSGSRTISDNEQKKKICTISYNTTCPKAWSNIKCDKCDYYKQI